MADKINLPKRPYDYKFMPELDIVLERMQEEIDAAGVGVSSGSDITSGSPLWTTNYDVAGIGTTAVPPWKDKHVQADSRIALVTGSDVPVDADIYSANRYRPSGKAMRVNVQVGDVAAGANRAEVLARYPNSFGGTAIAKWDDPVGSTRWYGFSVFIPADFTEDTTGLNWMLITQLKGYQGGSPPVSIEIKNLNFRLGGVKGANSGRIPNDGNLGAITKGAWHRIVFGVKLSTGTDGWVEGWLNGVNTVPRVTGIDTIETISSNPDPIYLKQGIYRASTWSVAHTFHFGPTKVGDSRLAVMNPDVAPSSADLLKYQPLGVAATKPLPLNAKVVLFGDSLVAQTLGTGTNYVAYQSIAFPTWALLRINNALYLPPNGNQGIAGQTTTQMVARLGAALAVKPAVVIIEAGTNDIAGGATAATVIGNLTYIVKAFLSIGARVVWATVPPRFAPAALSGAQETVRGTVNTFILAQASDVVKVINLDQVANNTSFFTDGLHYNGQGAFVVSEPAAAALLTWVDDTRISDSLFTDNSFTGNPLMTGTTGTKTLSTGNVATTWTLDGTNAGGATIVGSKTTDANLNQQVITVSGNYTGSAQRVDFNAVFNTAGLVAGDVVEGFADIEILTTDANLLTIDTGLLIWNAGFATLAQAEGILALDQVSPGFVAGSRFTFRTPPIAIGAGTPTMVRQGVFFLFKNQGASTPIAMSFKIHRLGVRKAQ